MRKKILTVMLSVMMVSGFATTAMAAPGEQRMIITHPEAGVTEGGCEESFGPHSVARSTYFDIVGIGNDDRGPWEHGVVFSGASGTVYSNYTNKKYWHGSSVRGSAGTKRSRLVAPNIKSRVSDKTVWWNGNHAYWRVDTNKK